MVLGRCNAVPPASMIGDGVKLQVEIRWPEGKGAGGKHVNYLETVDEEKHKALPLQKRNGIAVSLGIVCRHNRIQKTTEKRGK